MEENAALPQEGLDDSVRGAHVSASSVSMKAPSTDDELELLEKKIEEENQGPNTKDLVKIALFVIIGAVLIYLLLGVFGFLSQAEYGGP